MDTTQILLELAIIFFFSKLFGLAAEIFHAPQVVGEILAGIIIGPTLLGWVQPNDTLSILAEVGVVLLMFFAGLETNLKDLLNSGLKALLIACCGVIVPVVLGYVLYGCFYGFPAAGSDSFFEALFIGAIMSATSVSITVAALTELGKLRTPMGTAVMGAAIIDDVLGIIVLTFITGLRNPSGGGAWPVLGKTGLFFALSVGVGFAIFRIFRLIDNKHPKSRRLSVFGVAMCFALSYCAERFFGIADVTGAYVAGIILCSLSDADFVAKDVDTSSYLIFSPIFFGSIGIKTAIDLSNTSMLLFSVLFVLVALVSKVIGCGLSARLAGFGSSDSIEIGIGMMTRGEVALIVAQKGLSAGVLSADFFMPTILMIIVSSIVTPIVLRSYIKKNEAKAAQ